MRRIARKKPCARRSAALFQRVFTPANAAERTFTGRATRCACGVQLVCSGVGIIAAAFLFFGLAFFLPPLGAAMLAMLAGFTLGAVIAVHVIGMGNYFITREEERDKGVADLRLHR